LGEHITLVELRRLAVASGEKVVDLAVGSPVDAPPDFVSKTLGESGTERGYPFTTGTVQFREAFASWVGRSFGVKAAPEQVIAVAGAKEFIATSTWLLRKRNPKRSVVLIPKAAYPTYREGALLGGGEPFEIPEDSNGVPQLQLVREDVVERALSIWANSPSNPSGAVYDLGSWAACARRVGAVLISDECYVDFVWGEGRQTVLEQGFDGVIALYSLSKRSNLAGARIGAAVGDQGILSELVILRRALGLIASGPSQAAAVAALSDEEHVKEQRERYLSRLKRMSEALGRYGVPNALPAGGIFLWPKVPDRWGGSADALCSHLADRGIVVAPGAMYGDETRIRLAASVRDESVTDFEERLSHG